MTCLRPWKSELCMFKKGGGGSFLLLFKAEKLLGHYRLIKKEDNITKWPIALENSIIMSVSEYNKTWSKET